MPSGITADIYEGKDLSLRDYLMRVGRLMGFAVLQRDDDFDEPVKPGREVPASFYDDYIQTAREKLRALQKMETAEAEVASRAEFAEQKLDYYKRLAEVAELRVRYEEMLEQVRAWQPDPALEFVKEHAEKYLLESIQFDCGTRHIKPPTPLDAHEWLATERDRAKRDVEYWTEQREKEITRINTRNRMINLFLDSLPES